MKPSRISLYGISGPEIWAMNVRYRRSLKGFCSSCRTRNCSALACIRKTYGGGRPPGSSFLQAECGKVISMLLEQSVGLDPQGRYLFIGREVVEVR